MIDPATRLALDDALQRLAAGDRASIEPSLATLRPTVARFCARLLDPTDAQDATQATLLKVFERVATYDAERDAIAWVLAIAAWECRTIHGKRSRRRETVLADDDSACTTDERTPERAFREAELHASIVATTGSLRDEDRQAIARMLADTDDSPLDARSRKRRERALMRLRDAWRKAFG